LNNTNQTPIFHLGLTKTGSTLLQRFVFREFTNIKFYPKKKFDSYREILSNSNNSKNLFSSEMDKNLFKYLKQIISEFPKAKIIVVFREPSDWIISKYKYKIRKHSSLNFNQFFDIENNLGLWKKEDLNYSRIIGEIENICNSKPLFLSYDSLKKNPAQFIEEIEKYSASNFSGDRKKLPIINKSFSDQQLRSLIKFNKFYPYKKATYSIKTLNKIHYKYREFLLHSIAFISLIFSRKKQVKPIVSRELKLKIKKHFEKDWAQCKKKFASNNKLRPLTSDDDVKSLPF